MRYSVKLWTAKVFAGDRLVSQRPLASPELFATILLPGKVWLPVWEKPEDEIGRP